MRRKKKPFFLLDVELFSMTTKVTTKAPVMRYIRVIRIIRIDIDPARIFFARGTVQIIHGKRGVISMAGTAMWSFA